MTAPASASVAPARRLVVEGAHVATVDAHDTEHAGGHVVVDGSRIVAVGPGPSTPGRVGRPTNTWGAS